MKHEFNVTRLAHSLEPGFDPGSIVGSPTQVVNPVTGEVYYAIIASISLVGTETEVKGATFTILYEDLAPEPPKLYTPY